MLTNFYTMYDTKAELFCRPFLAMNDQVAKRMFAELINNPDTDMGKWPADYTLFALGQYDDTTAEITLMEKASLGNGIEYVTEKPLHRTASEATKSTDDQPPINDAARPISLNTRKTPKASGGN